MTSHAADTAGRAPIYLLAENVRSLFNVGALFRTADGVNASGICLAGFTGRPPRKEIARVALSAEESVPWWYAEDPVDAAQGLSATGVQMVALEQTSDSIDYRDFPYRFPVGLVVGHEVEGVSPATVAACEGAVHLPMSGTKSSLNVSVAAAVGLYHLSRLLDEAADPTFRPGSTTGRIPGSIL